MNSKFILIGISLILLLSPVATASLMLQWETSVSKAIGNEAFEKAIKTAEDNVYMAKGADLLLDGGKINVDDLAIAVKGKISRDELAEGIVNVGKLESVEGVKILDDSSIKTLRNHGTDPGAWAEVKVAVNRMDDMDVLKVNKKFNNQEYDIFSKYRGTNKGLIEEVKNGKYNPDEFDEAIIKLKSIKGSSIEGISITDVRLTVSGGFFNAIPEDKIAKAAKEGISITSFKGVK